MCWLFLGQTNTFNFLEEILFNFLEGNVLVIFWPDKSILWVIGVYWKIHPISCRHAKVQGGRSHIVLSSTTTHIPVRPVHTMYTSTTSTHAMQVYYHLNVIVSQMSPDVLHVAWDKKVKCTRCTTHDVRVWNNMDKRVKCTRWTRCSGLKQYWLRLVPRLLSRSCYCCRSCWCRWEQEVKD